MYFFMIVASLGALTRTDTANIVTSTFSGLPGDTVDVNTTNYQIYLPRGVSHHDMKHNPRYAHYTSLLPYDMPEHAVYTFLFTVRGDNGTVRIQFQEYDLNPRSVLYMYDGGNVSAAGSIWTHHSPLPVYSSTGTHLFMVFKTGQDAANKHMGFVAYVYFTDEAHWTNPPMTGFCGPLTRTKESVLLADVVYLEEHMNASVYCSYSSHIDVSREVLLVASTAPGDVYVRDFPSAAVGRMISPYTQYKMEYGRQEVTLQKFNDRYAKHGFHIELKPQFSKPLQKVLILLGGADDVKIKLIQKALDEHDVTDWNCPYKKCPSHGGCFDFRKPCWFNESPQLSDGTCDLFDLNTDQYTQCGSGNHCYNSQIDRCDGFTDCEDAKDELDCPNSRTTTATTSSISPDSTFERLSQSKRLTMITIYCVVTLFGLVFGGLFIWYLCIKCKHRCRRPPEQPQELNNGIVLVDMRHRDEL